MTITAIHDCKIDDRPFVMGEEYEAEVMFGMHYLYVLVYTVLGAAMMSISEARKHFIGI